MKRNVNLLLLGLIVFCICLMLAMALFYNTTYDALKSDYDRSKTNITLFAEELNKTMAEVRAKEEMLNSKENILINYMNELNLSKERETSLGQHFIDIKSENTYLYDKLNKTLIERDRWKTSYDTTKREYDVCKVDYEAKNQESNERLNEIVRIRNLKPLLQSSSGKISQREDDIGVNINRIGSSADQIKNLANMIDNATLRDAIKGEADDIKSRTNLMDDILDTLKQNIAELDYSIGRI